MCRLASCDGDDDDTNSPQEVDHHSCKSVKMSPRRPFIVFMAGGMGVGKSYALRWAYNKGYFDTSRYVMVDPDRLKCMLPEMRELIRRDRSTAGTLTHAESTYIAEIAQECALQEGKNIIVDVSHFTPPLTPTLFQCEIKVYGSLLLLCTHCVAVAPIAGVPSGLAMVPDCFRKASSRSSAV